MKVSKPRSWFQDLSRPQSRGLGLDVVSSDLGLNLGLGLDLVTSDLGLGLGLDLATKNWPWSHVQRTAYCLD